MKKMIVLLVCLSAVMMLFACAKKVNISIQSMLDTTTALSASPSMAPAHGASADIDSYVVTLKMIEIGNSERKKFVVWENADGETFDITDTVTFTGLTTLRQGTYNYIRFTIDPTLAITGSVEDNGTNYYSGTAQVTVDEKQLFSAEDGTISSPISIEDGTLLILNFRVKDTVTYSSNPEGINVDKPVLTLTY